MIFTFATPDYMPEAENLRRSAAAYGHDVTIIRAPERGSWADNCSQKAGIVRETLEQHEQVLFLDADAFLKSDPRELLLPHNGIRLAVSDPYRFRFGQFAQRYRYHAMRYGGMWNSGILSVRRTPDTLALCDAWARVASEAPGEWDQMCLQWAHIETGSAVPVTPLPRHLCAGGPVVGHRSAFHRKWKAANERPVRRVLVLGSAPYLPGWWSQNGKRYQRAGFSICPMNNAIGVVEGDAHIWLVPNDYAGPHYAGPDVVTNLARWNGATNRAGNWVTKPHWHGPTATTIFSTLYHVLNEAHRDGCRPVVHVAASDMVYPAGGQTHFYGNGNPDPLRFTDDALYAEQRRLIALYSQIGGEVVNAGGQSETRLVFDRGELQL